MKHIVVATDCFAPRMDGVSKFLEKILPQLSKRYKITVIAPYFGKLPKKPLGVHRLVRFNTYDFSVADIKIARVERKKMEQIIKTADVVWSHTLGPIGFNAIRYGKKNNIFVVSFIHSIEFELFSKALSNAVLQKVAKLTMERFVRYAYNKCHLLMVPSLEVAEILTWKDVKTQKKVVTLGVDTERFSPLTASQRRVLRREMGFSESDRVIVFVGRLGWEKGLRTLLRAFLRVEKKFASARLLIVGEGRREIKSMFEGREHVILAGPQEKVERYYQVADIYVLPSLTETTSLSTLEAMATELAVVATPVGLIKYYIMNGQNGYLFPKNNDLILAKYLADLIGNPPLCGKLGIQARHSVQSQYTWKKTVEKIIEIFETLVE